jgi:hypothetical protein
LEALPSKSNPSSSQPAILHFTVQCPRYRYNLKSLTRIPRLASESNFLPGKSLSAHENLWFNTHHDAHVSCVNRSLFFEKKPNYRLSSFQNFQSIFSGFFSLHFPFPCSLRPSSQFHQQIHLRSVFVLFADDGRTNSWLQRDGQLNVEQHRNKTKTEQPVKLKENNQRTTKSEFGGSFHWNLSEILSLLTMMRLCEKQKWHKRTEVIAENVKRHDWSQQYRAWRKNAIDGRKVSRIVRNYSQRAKNIASAVEISRTEKIIPEKGKILGVEWKGRRKRNDRERIQNVADGRNQWKWSQ